ncbi:contactin, partial [Biomphalaria glabrata]
IHGAGVLSVDNMEENFYITTWLQKNDPFQQEWYTSGVYDPINSATLNGSTYKWESTGNAIENALMSQFIEAPNIKIVKGVIVYSYGPIGIGWKYVDGTPKKAYICKIAEKEAYRIVLTNRGFDYGIENPDMNKLEFGPYFIQQPHSVVVVSSMEPLVVECIVLANPEPVYKWFRGNNFVTEVNEDLDSRYSVTNGKLTITDPDDVKDSNLYRCQAENKFGKIISDTVEISFGYLGEFNNVQDAGTRAKAYEGAQVTCSKLNYKPAVVYTWIKAGQQFVRPEYQTYIFISANGRLYFSEVTMSDEAEYTCVVSLSGVNQYTIGSLQPPSRNSLPIPLIVDAQMPQADWGPVIQNDFIGVYPSPPLAGQDIRMECFAYGSTTSPFFYTWTREDKPMSTSAFLTDSNRVLIIPEAKLEDSGIYRCTVRRGASKSDTKVISLTLGARPYFLNQLQNQHADIDSQLTWICNARGSPEPVYTWYKNGVKIVTDPDKRITIQKNVLIISHLSADIHDGMYQCGAANTHGTSITSAQLRVLAFKPNLNKYPPPETLMAPLTGNITIRCQPEGSPFPKIEWTHGSNAITSDGSKYTILSNGNLFITSLTNGDQGRYTCKASNTYGVIEASTTLTIAEGTTIILGPTDQQDVIINKTIFLNCDASHPNGMDVVYEWTFNGFPLFLEEMYYKVVQDANQGSNGLYVVNAQFRHEGMYTCTVRTPFNSQSKSAYVTIKGPPKEAAGVHTLPGTTTSSQTSVAWTAGSGSGGQIIAHFIQYASDEFPNDWTETDAILVADSYRQNDVNENKHSYTVTGLNPGSGYRFRVVAQNEYGRGDPSLPSPYIQMFSAAPAIAPRNLRGGGGSVGDLVIRWDPLHRSEYGSTTVNYKIYWRQQNDKSKDGGLWIVDYIVDPNQDMMVKQVGVDNYYLIYEVIIQANNSFGFGPNSSVAEVYSADGIPLVAPLNVQSVTHNTSAVDVWWEPLAETREIARGKILGYQINYWIEGESPDLYRQFIRYYGNCDKGVVIGLPNDINAVVDVQVYNQAGLGPRSSWYIYETHSFQPLTYPQEIRVTSAGQYQARVWWRGVTITVLEEDLTGYSLFYWVASENYRSATEVFVPGRAHETVLTNLSDNRIYALRLAAVGKGGTGSRTPITYFTFEGQVLIDSSFAETIDTFLSIGVQIQSYIVIIVVGIILALV